GRIRVDGLGRGEAVRREGPRRRGAPLGDRRELEVDVAAHEAVLGGASGGATVAIRDVAVLAVLERRQDYAVVTCRVAGVARAVAVAVGLERIDGDPTVVGQIEDAVAVGVGISVVGDAVAVGVYGRYAARFDGVELPVAVGVGVGEVLEEVDVAVRRELRHVGFVPVG